MKPRIVCTLTLAAALAACSVAPATVPAEPTVTISMAAPAASAQALTGVAWATSATIVDGLTGQSEAVSATLSERVAGVLGAAGLERSVDVFVYPGKPVVQVSAQDEAVSVAYCIEQLQDVWRVTHCDGEVAEEPATVAVGTRISPALAAERLVEATRILAGRSDGMATSLLLFQAFEVLRTDTVDGFGLAMSAAFDGSAVLSVDGVYACVSVDESRGVAAVVDCSDIALFNETVTSLPELGD